MSRSPRSLTGLAVSGAVGACALGASVAGAQSTTPARPARGPVSDLVLPVLDLDLETASLDNSVRRSDTARTIRVTLDTDLLFAFNRARLSRRAGRRIDQAVAEIKRLKPAKVSIEGHTDNKGSPAYNLSLSRRRADAVRRALAGALGGDGPRLVAKGKGEREPVASNTKRNGKDNPRGRALNRRVEIKIPKR